MVSLNLHGERALGNAVGIVMFIVFVILVTGCISKPSMTPKNETPTVPPAPNQLYVKVGQPEQFTYWGHNISINYTSAYSTQNMKVTLDGAERTFQKESTESPAGIYWKEGNLSFTLKPVVWEIRQGQKVPIYESTWNTSEIYFEVQIMFASKVTGGLQT